MEDGKEGANKRLFCDRDLIIHLRQSIDFQDVLNQIDIPKQTEEIHWLSFSPIEEHFYRYYKI